MVELALWFAWGASTHCQASRDSLCAAQQVFERPKDHEGAVLAGEARMELPQQLRRRQRPAAVRLLRCAGAMRWMTDRYRVGACGRGREAEGDERTGGGQAGHASV